MVRKEVAGGVSVALDFTSAPVPDRRFSADAAWVVLGSDLVRILFAQYRAAGPQVEHVVVVRVPFTAVRYFVSSMESVGPQGKEYLARVKNPPSPEVDKDKLPEQTFTLDANIMVAGFSDREACIDLYNSSAQAKVALKQGSGEFRAEPIARVFLTTRLLIDLFDELSAMVSKLPADVLADEVVHE